MRVDGPMALRCVGAVALLLAGVGGWFLWVEIRDFEMFPTYTSKSFTEEERIELEGKTGLRFPGASRFVLCRRHSGLQGGDTSLKLHLSDGELQKFLDQKGFVETAPSIGSDPIVDDPDVPEWRPSYVRQPLRRQSPGDGWKEPKVHVLAEVAPGEPHIVYVNVSDPLN